MELPNPALLRSGQAYKTCLRCLFVQATTAVEECDPESLSSRGGATALFNSEPNVQVSDTTEA